VHVPLEKLPLPLELKVTVPVGEIPVPELESLTVAVQVVPTPTATLLGAQTTAVALLRLVTLRAKGLPLLLLAECVLSPPYAPVMFCVPSLPAAGVKLTAQLALAPPPFKEQFVGEKLPPPATLVLKLAVPVGVIGLEFVSVTVAVHEVVALTATVAGEQATEVVVAWITAVTDSVALPLLPEWLSWSAYVAVMVRCPSGDAGVYATAHPDEFALIAASAQVVALNEPCPEGDADHVMFPVGALFWPEALSVTVAVHVVAEPTITDEGEQVTDVNVDRAAGVVPVTVPVAVVPWFWVGVTDIVALLGPNDCGVKVTVNVALPPAGTSMELVLTMKLASEDATAALFAFESLL
jgi:hypothetical protein